MNNQNVLIIYKNPERLTTMVNIFIFWGGLNVLFLTLQYSIGFAIYQGNISTYYLEQNIS